MAKRTGAMAIKPGSPTHKAMRLGADGAVIWRADGALPSSRVATDTQLRALESLGLAELEREGFRVVSGRLNGYGLARLAELDAEAETLRRRAARAA